MVALRFKEHPEMPDIALPPGINELGGGFEDLNLI
jgi:hypothetical protein